MLLNQRSKFLWQLVICSTNLPALVVKNSVLYLFLHSQFPQISENDQLRIDLAQLKNKDICGACFMPNNNQLIAFLKQQCINFFNDEKDNLPEQWTEILNKFNDTSAAHFIAYANVHSLSTRNRYIIHAFITKNCTAEYRNEIEKVNFQG